MKSSSSVNDFRDAKLASGLQVLAYLDQMVLESKKGNSQNPSQHSVENPHRIFKHKSQSNNKRNEKIQTRNRQCCC